MMAYVKTPNTTYQVAAIQSKAGYVRRQKWTHPALGSTTAVHAAINSAAVVTTGITNPDFARVLTVVGAGSGHNAAGTVTINGTDIRGNTIADTLTLNSNTTVVGTKAFKTVTSIDFTAVTGNDANNTVAVGTGAPLGLDRLMDADEYINGSVDGVFEGTRATVAVDSTDISKNTVSFNTALANTKTYRAVYVTKELTRATQTTS
jgi:hypothetical protein